MEYKQVFNLVKLSTRMNLSRVGALLREEDLYFSVDYFAEESSSLIKVTWMFANGVRLKFKMADVFLEWCIYLEEWLDNCPIVAHVL